MTLPAIIRYRGGHYHVLLGIPPWLMRAAEREIETARLRWESGQAQAPTAHERLVPLTSEEEKAYANRNLQ